MRAMRHALRPLAALCALAFLLKAVMPVALAAEQPGAGGSQPEHPCMMDGAAPGDAGHDYGGCCDGAGCDCGCLASHFPLPSPGIAPQRAVPSTSALPALAPPRGGGAPTAPFRPPA